MVLGLGEEKSPPPYSPIQVFCMNATLCVERRAAGMCWPNIPWGTGHAHWMTSQCSSHLKAAPSFSLCRQPEGMLSELQDVGRGQSCCPTSSKVHHPCRKSLDEAYVKTGKAVHFARPTKADLSQTTSLTSVKVQLHCLQAQRCDTIRYRNAAVLLARPSKQAETAAP